MSAPPQPEPPKEEPKLSPAEMKKKAKAEKQARRAAQKEQQQGGTAGPSSAGPAPAAANGEASGQRPEAGSSQQKPRNEQAPRPQQPQRQIRQENEAQSRRGGAQSQQTTLPTRRRPSQNAPAPPAASLRSQKKDAKQLELLSHLYTQPRRHTVEGVSKDVHPAVLALGFQISSYEICGSSARCVAMLLAFQKAIQSYTTPTGTSLARHLTSHYLSPQIDFLKSCRPISESMGNAIRWLKKLIVEIDPSTPEQSAKNELCERIDAFIHERITVTDQAIAVSASSLIKNGSVVLTYAKSSIVEKTIVEAHASGKNFRVIVVDSRPLFEGKVLATSLMNAGVDVEYVPFSGISHAIKQATIVLLGAHSMLSNGRLQSRVGTAPIAMRAAKMDIPVIVCCESVKFSGKVALDSIVSNEVAPPEELLLPPKEFEVPKEGEEVKEKKVKTLRDWKEIPNLQILNLMYDVTPAEYIRMVICEYGSLPPSSVPVVHRLANEGM